VDDDKLFKKLDKTIQLQFGLKKSNGWKIAGIHFV